MITLLEIYKFLSGYLNIKENELNQDSDIYKEFGIDGDDFSELIISFSEKFNVDLSEFLWYFHYREEGFNIGAIFIKPPYERVERIAITPRLLLKQANAGKWSIEYPKHTLPKKRYDIIISWLFFVILILLSLIGWIQNA
jgi:acyl carrier protein